ncbi:AhpC-TSA-domain-containing protein [Testicularia cyperi]|uniref:thioredoxin-dependent peroxiredoxin n=1 Tax=Testicularia cyperi TaxID=1882483 RepID=A0A317XJ31_9BASI|nr:AhpC-TSA-domain-containing protein [Testicularia cyperi]
MAGEEVAPRRSARNAGKPASAPAPVTKAPTKAAPKRKSEPEPEPEAEAKPASGDAKKAKAATEPSSGGGGAGQLKVGDSIPSGLTLKTESNDSVDISSLRKAVLFSYPRANTSGCTTQANLYRDNYSAFKDAGYEVYGLSNDGAAALKSWKEKRGFQYSLLSDPKRELIGVLTGSKDKTKRSHFVIGEDGKLGLIALSVKPPESFQHALDFIEKQK